MIKDPIKLAESKKRYYERNKEKLREKQREYYSNNKEASKTYRELNREILLEKCRKYHKDNPDKEKVYYENNKDSIDLYRKQWIKDNPDKMKEAYKIYSSNNLDKVAAKSAKRRSSKLNRTPSWLTDIEFKEIEQIYKLSRLLTKQTGIKHHVDHIIPLQGKLVSGLHVPSNLQVILAVDNLIKSNNY